MILDVDSKDLVANDFGLLDLENILQERRVLLESEIEVTKCELKQIKMFIENTIADYQTSFSNLNGHLQSQEVDEIFGERGKINTFIASRLNGIANVVNVIYNSVRSSVSSLQFNNIVSQFVEHINYIIINIEETFQLFSRTFTDVKVCYSDDHIEKL